MTQRASNTATERINELSRRIAAIEGEKAALISELEALRKGAAAHEINTSATSISSSQKVAIFLNLFRGREDVFAKRWDNAKTGRSGYAPACHNEWVPGICGKPRIKCGECPNQACVLGQYTTVRFRCCDRKSISSSVK